MTISEREQQANFENEVRRVARELWPEAQYSGAHMVEGKERDGLFETEDCIHLLEATVSRSQAKAKTDVDKLVSLARKIQTKLPHKAVKCWFVCRDEPTADQRTVTNKHQNLVNALSFSQFQSKIVDASSYLGLRDFYAFGSVRDPATGSPKIDIEYVPLDFVQVGQSELWSIKSIRDGLIEGKRFVLLGDYGAGKSMSLRQLYKELKASYLKKKTFKFPIYLNLRDHFGQTNPAEVLERHARNLGFQHPQHLVRAWRAGYVILLIDGFDELATLGIQGLWKKLQESRYRAMQTVREFIRDQPHDAGVVLTGRAHFFDSEKERKSALGISSDFVELTLNEFSDEQIQRYLGKSGLKGKVPQWMPSRPLLVGYLTASGLLKDFLITNENESQAGGNDPARGWHMILDRICAREAEIEAGIDGQTIRRILERLATLTRASQTGLGPISRDQVVTAFSEICGYSPDEKGMLLLQRLPGLGIERADEGTRSFIDIDLADACRSGDVYAFITDPYTTNPFLFRGAECGLGSLGVNIASIRMNENNFTSGKLNAAIKRAGAHEDLAFLLLDLSLITIESQFSLEVPVTIKGILIPHLDLDASLKDCSKLLFRDCYFSSIGIDPDLKAEYIPRFEACYFDEIDGRSSATDLPIGAFDKACVFSRFSESPDTTAAIGAMELPLGSRVLLTILKKVYLRSGSGRKENALHRGLDHHGRRLVTPILRLLQREGLLIAYNRGNLDMPIWVPDRTQTARVASIVTSPHTCDDSLLKEAATIV